MRKVIKYELDSLLMKQRISTHAESVVLKVSMEAGGRIYVYLEVNTNNPVVRRSFFMYGTNEEIKSSYYYYVGSIGSPIYERHVYTAD